MGCGASTMDVEHASQGVAEGRPADAQQVAEHLVVPPKLGALLQHAFNAPAAYELGFTTGHSIITSDDEAAAQDADASLLYGEILPTQDGMLKLMDKAHLDAASARRFVDCGSGSGRMAIAMFLAFPNLVHVLGVELSKHRHALAANALLRLVDLQPARFAVETFVSGRLRVVDSGSGKVGPRKPGTKALKGGTPGRVLELMCGDMWAISPHYITAADVISLHTEFSASSADNFRATLRNMREGCRFLTYNDPTCWFGGPDQPCPFQQVPANVSEEDTFQTSWAHERGHHLFCWHRTGGVGGRALVGDEGESKRGT